MIRVVIPDPESAWNLCRIEQAVNANGAWSPKDLIALGSPPEAAILADDAVERGLLLLRFAADEGEILNLAVVPEARRQGLARALLEHGIALARELGNKKLFLEVATDNGPALALYRSSGFEEIGKRARYYGRSDGSRVDAIVMALEL